MKKLVTVAAVSLLVVGLSASMAFADTPARGNANGLQLSGMGYTVDELLEVKLNRIDELVDIGRLTTEQGDQFKAAIRARMDNCDGTGSQVNERLAIGFGRTMAKGAMNGGGNQFNQ